MSDLLTVVEGERGLVRLFAVNLTPEQVKPMLAAPEGTDVPNPTPRPTDEAAARLLGISEIDAAHCELLPLRDLTGVGLDGYLTEGLGIPDDAISADRARLKALEGYVLLVHTEAFSGRESLTPGPALTPIALYHKPGTDWRSVPTPAQAALQAQGGAAASAKAPLPRGIWGLTALALLLIAGTLYLVLS